MSEAQVRVVELAPMRFASVLGYGREPETEAHRKLRDYAGPKGYLEDAAQHRVFGFNNPGPSPATPNYGYELWVAVGEDAEPEGDVRIVDSPGGLYAVKRVGPMIEPGPVIGEAWQALSEWVDNSGYRMATHQWLEEHLGLPGDGAEWCLDLYCPIAE